MIGIRGAIRVTRNERASIYRETQRLLGELLRRNELGSERIVSAFFTMTPDLNADFPAYAARELGWTDVPMLGAQETAVPGALDRMVRVLLHADAPGPARHVYLGDAAAMRPDLVEEGDAAFGGRAAPPEPDAPRFGSLLVVGLGLIGGSAALALRRRGLFEEVLGHDVSSEAEELARRAGAVAGSPGTLEAGLERADAVLLALPVREMLGWPERRGGRLRPGAVVMDVGSTKRELVRALERLPGEVEAVSAHPMAGSEESGMRSARPDLFHGSTWALVETARTGERARELAEAVTRAVGARPYWTSAGEHDRATAITSHLPYLVSCALAEHVAGRISEDPVRTLMGPGVMDMTRLAASAPEVMAGILETNWPELRREAERFRDRLAGLTAELDEALPARSGAGRVGARADEAGARESGLARRLESARAARRSLEADAR